MSALVLLSLPLSLLVVVSLAVLAFEDVAFRMAFSPQQAGPGGGRLASQAVPTAELVTTAGRLVGENRLGTTQLTCPTTPFMPIVTDVEARAIAAEVQRQGAAEVRRVVERSRTADGFCPMRLNDGLCACATVRPLNCIGRCLAGADSPEWTDGLGDSLSAAFRHHLETHHANASTQRLDQALLAVLDTPRTSPPVSRN